MPAEGNPLVQLLLERGVNGESPVKRRSPRKSTAACHTTPKSVRSAKVATKTPRTASKRARKSIVVSDANAADEEALPHPGIAPASTKKNKRSRSSTSKSKTTKSRGKRSGPRTKGVDFDGGGGAFVMSVYSCIDLNILHTLPALRHAFFLHTTWYMCACRAM